MEPKPMIYNCDLNLADNVHRQTIHPVRSNMELFLVNLVIHTDWKRCFKLIINIDKKKSSKLPIDTDLKQSVLNQATNEHWVKKSFLY